MPVAQQSADPVGLLEHRDVMAGHVQLSRRGKPDGRRSDDGDVRPVRDAAVARNHTFIERPFDDRQLDVL
jgi:hypothetical protein